MQDFKKAITKVISFLLIFSLLCTPSLAFYFKNGSNNNNILPELRTQNGKIDLIFCGASQSVWGFVPEIMDEQYGCNSFNISSGLLSMKGRYEIIETVMKKNPVKTLVMDLSIDCLEKTDFEPVEEKILLMEHLEISHRIRYALRNVKIDDIFPAFYYFLRTGSQSIIDFVLKKEQPNVKYRGKGYWGNRDAVDQTGDLQYLKSKQNLNLKYNVDSETEFYLEQIIKLCKNNNIDVILVTTPYPTKVLGWAGMNSISNEYVKIAQKYNCIYYDFNLYKNKDAIFDDSTSYYDAGHLSTEGAVALTTELAMLMKRNDKGIKNSDSFFVNYNDYVDNKFAYMP